MGRYHARQVGDLAYTDPGRAAVAVPNPRSCLEVGRRVPRLQ